MEKYKLTPKRKEIMQTLGFNSLFDVIRYFPYRYDHYQNELLSLEKHDQKVSFVGTISNDIKIERINRNRIKTSIILKNDKQDCKIIFFNQFKNTSFIIPGKQMAVIGKYNAFLNQITVSNFMISSLEDNEKYIPIYSLTSNIKDQTYRQFVNFAYNQIKDDIKDIIPEQLRNKYKLISLKEALYYIHFPSNSEQLRQANRYLKYEELLSFCMLGLTKRKILETNSLKINKEINYDYLKSFIYALPFKLTSDQKIVIKEILDDISSNKIMSRLIQGDVGSGKTIVAIISLLANYSSLYQGALMAPTDILAKQHYETLKKFIKDDKVKIALLVSSIKDKEKRKIYEDLEKGNIDIIVGTHALIQDNVIFKKLGLAIIDEQHRFGVKQRLLLKEKGFGVDILYMSATPIPRTLASTIYMDMDVSTIQVYPYANRIVNTKFIEYNSIKTIKKEISEYLKTKQKIYVICPSIDKSSLDISNVITIYQKWKELFPTYNIALLHGKLSSEEKEKTMDDFDKGNIQIIISTTVIEVGINIMDANMIIIYNAERFGLASIHQLRGRIARDGKVGYCYLLSDANSEEIKERLDFMANNNDGFKISEYDLKHRGAGDMLGLLQSGKSPFIISSLIDDFNILKEAKKDAKYLVDNKEKYPLINDYILNIIHKSDKYVD